MLEPRGTGYEFGDFLDDNANKVGYLYATRGQLCTPALRAQRAAQYPTKAKLILGVAKKWDGEVVADCQGVVEMFWSKGNWDIPLSKWLYADVTSAGIYKLAKLEGLPNGLIGTLPIGLPFPVAIGYPGHVGYWYKGKVYQSSGHAYGLEITDLKDMSHNIGHVWMYWYYIPFLDYTIKQEEDMNICKRGDTKSAIVASMQTGLNKLGSTLATDGNFGPASSAALLAFKAKNNLAGGGDIFTAYDNAMMTIKLASIPVVTSGITQAQWDAATKKAAEMTDNIKAKQIEINGLKAKMSSAITTLS